MTQSGVTELGLPAEIDGGRVRDPEQPAMPPLGPQAILPARVFHNAWLMSDFAGTTGHDSLRQCFLEGLAKIQPIQVHFHAADADIFLNFRPENEREEEAFRTVMVVPELPGNWEFSPEERAALSQRTRDAQQLIQAVDSDLDAAIRTIVGAFLFARLEHYEGGSISSFIGAIWIGLPPSRPVLDFAELIVHEYVHQCLFLEDMVHTIFVDGEERMAREDGLVTSAILQIRRGYDKSFHSAVVALVLARFYGRLGMLEKVQKLMDPLRVTVAELASRTQFLTAHGRTVLAEVLNCINES